MALADISSKAWLQNSPAARLERAKRYLGTRAAVHSASTFKYTRAEFGSRILNNLNHPKREPQ